jgi:hypothetical protein
MLVFTFFSFSVASPVFLTMFQTEMKEENEGQVEIQDFDKDTVERLIKWIYSGEVELQQEDFGGFMNLYQAAHKYCIDPLKEYLVAQIVAGYKKAENALEILAVGTTYGEKLMVDAAKEIIKR